MKIFEKLRGLKTHLSVAGLVLTALAGLVGGDLSPYEFMLAVFGGAGVSSLRASIANKR